MMNKNHSFENKFNGAARDAGEAGGGRPKRMSARIVYFDDIDKAFADDMEAGDVLREKMERAMEPIDLDPKSFNAIKNYGTEPIKKLGAVGKGILSVQSKFDEQVKVMNITQDKLLKGEAELGLDQLLDGVKKLGSGLGSAAVGAGSFLGRLLKSTGDRLSGAAKKRAKATEEEAHIQAMLSSLPEMHMEMLLLAKDMKEIGPAIDKVIEAAEKLGAARVESVRELNVFVGAAPEVLRRYSEIYIKDAKEAFDLSGDPEDELYLTDVIQAKETFQMQYSYLTASIAQGIVAAQQLRGLIEQMKKQRMIIEQSIAFRENEWAALLAGAGFAGTVLKIEEKNKKNAEAGDRIHQITEDMAGVAHEMALNSDGRGTVSNEKLIASLANMQQRLEKEAAINEQRNRELDADRRALVAASERFLDAVDVNKQARILEAAPETKAKPDKGKANVNDNTVQTEAAATDAPPQRKANKGSGGLGL